MERMQKKNNPEDDPIRGCCNLMAAFLCGGMWDFIRVCKEKAWAVRRFCRKQRK
jgi:hypothetical protein